MPSSFEEEEEPCPFGLESSGGCPGPSPESSGESKVSDPGVILLLEFPGSLLGL